MKGDPQTTLMEMMAKLRAPGEGAKAVPRSPNIPALGQNPTQPVMATPGEKFVPPEIVRQPGMFGLLSSLNEGNSLKSLYDTVAKPIQAFTTAMSIWGAMAGPAGLVNSVYAGDKNPLEAAISVAENVTRMRRSKGEEDVGMAIDKETPIIGRMGGGGLNWGKGGNAIGPTDTQPTMMDPGGFVLNKDASEHLDMDMGKSPLFDDEPPRLFGDPQAQGKEPFDWSKIQGLISQAQMYHKKLPSFGWDSAPEFHQALYGTYPAKKTGDTKAEQDQRALQLVSATSGGSMGMVAGLLGGGDGGGGGGLGGGGIGDIFKSILGGGSGDEFSIGGGQDGGGGNIPELIKVLTELITIMKGQESNDHPVSNSTSLNPSMSGPQSNRRTQGINWGSVFRFR